MTDTGYQNYARNHSVLRDRIKRRVDLAWEAGQDGPTPDQRLASIRAVALGDRLLDVENQTLQLRGEIARLRRELDNSVSGGGGGGWFDIPRSKHPWALSDKPDTDIHSLGLYDRRVDDDVLLEGRTGEAFLKDFGLDGPPSSGHTSKFAEPINYLNSLELSEQIIIKSSIQTPDISIIIPVYGQLAYTLNCIHSLLTHVSRFSYEIVIVDDCSPDQTGDFLPKLTSICYFKQPTNGGFIHSCNTGAKLARGRYVLLLNNDTRVVSGWLDALIDTYKIYPNAGVVGSKLLYADGTLQEAGGIIWRDGSCWNYGRNDDPNRPHYSHAREVDYISGCSIVVPSDLWHRLGGFDPHYTPAYCEDADLCLRVIEAGRQVIFQPQSRIVHYEGKTSGTDTSYGVKAYQVVNNRKLFLRWRRRLERHRPNAEAPYFERERVPSRRILVVDATTPTPKQDAGSVQTLLALQVCCESGYKTHFVAAHNWLFQKEYTTDLQKMGVECAYAPYDVNFEHYIRRYGLLFDVVLVYRMNVLEPIVEAIRKYSPQSILLFHVADLHFLRQHRQATLENNPEALAEAEITKTRELSLVSAADCTITHSFVEAEVVTAELPNAAVTVWPLMYEFFGTHAKFETRRDICFLGGYGHPPNIDAVNYFVEEIFPIIRHLDPSIRFIVAGANATTEVLDLHGDGVEVIGMVDNLRDLFDKTRVFVCPLRYGAGAKGKILSAMSYGIPIVSTSVGIEGAGLSDNVHALVADTPEEFVERVLLLYRDEALWTRLSANGQDIVRQNFSAEMGRPILEKAIDAAYKRKYLLSET